MLNSEHFLNYPQQILIASMVKYDMEKCQYGMMHIFDDSDLFEAYNQFDDSQSAFDKQKDEHEEKQFSQIELPLLESFIQFIPDQQNHEEREEIVQVSQEPNSSNTNEYNRKNKRKDQNLTKKINIRGINVLKELQVSKNVRKYLKKSKANYQCFILTLEAVRFTNEVEEFKRKLQISLSELEQEYQEKNSVQECEHLNLQKKKIFSCIQLFFGGQTLNSYFSLFQEKKKASNNSDDLTSKLSQLKIIMAQNDY